MAPAAAANQESLQAREGRALFVVASVMRASAAVLPEESDVGRALARWAAELSVRAEELGERPRSPRAASPPPDR